MDDIFGDLPPLKASQKDQPAFGGAKRKSPDDPGSTSQAAKKQATTPATGAGASTGTSTSASTSSGASNASSVASSSASASSSSTSTASSSAGAAAAAAASPAPRLYRVSLAQAHFGSKGRRQTMEDAHLAMSGDEVRASFPSMPAGMRVAMYGIFDGHGGRNVADLVKAELPGHIMAELMKDGNLPTPSTSAIGAAVERAWTAMDAESQSKASALGWSDG